MGVCALCQQLEQAMGLLWLVLPFLLGGWSICLLCGCITLIRRWCCAICCRCCHTIYCHGCNIVGSCDSIAGWACRSCFRWYATGCRHLLLRLGRYGIQWVRVRLYTPAP